MRQLTYRLERLKRQREDVEADKIWNKAVDACMKEIADLRDEDGTDIYLELNALQSQVHTLAKEKGFWDKENGQDNVPQKLMLIVSELAEAMEAHRKDRFTDPTTLKKHIDRELGRDGHEDTYQDRQAFKEGIKNTFEDELADALIRILDLAEGMNINLPAHTWLKHLYNEKRDHMHGGKKY